MSGVDNGDTIIVFINILLHWKQLSIYWHNFFTDRLAFWRTLQISIGFSWYVFLLLLLSDIYYPIKVKRSQNIFIIVICVYVCGIHMSYEWFQLLKYFLGDESPKKYYVCKAYK